VFVPAWRLAHWRMNTGSMLKIDSSNFFSGDIFNYVTNWMMSPVYLRSTEFSSWIQGRRWHVRFQVLMAASMKFWDIAPCSLEVDQRLRGVYCIHHQGLYFSKATWCYIPEGYHPHKRWQSAVESVAGCVYMQWNDTLPELSLVFILCSSQKRRELMEG
jgi:hypothetical protein